MVEGKASLVIDLGNSETRVMTIFGKTKSGKSRQRTSIIPNKFGELPDLRLVNNPNYDSKNSKVFVLNTDTVICSGDMCDKEKGTAALRPSSTMKKYESYITKYSLNLAILQGYEHIAEMSNQSLDCVDVVWDIYVLLPPSDLDLGRTLITDMIRSIDRLNFVMPKLNVAVKIDKVRVYPEGFCAFIGEVFESIKSIRKGYEDVLNSSTLVIDIGAGTTDLCIIKDAKLIDDSRFSEEKGGNQVFQKISKELRKKFGKSFPDETLRDAAVTGKAKVGARVEDVTSEVNNARYEVATELSTAIRNYIESSNFSIYDIENILICGGGADRCGSNMKPLGDYLRDNLKSWMSYSRFLEIPTKEEYIYEDGVETKVSLPISPRMLNILGAGVLAEKDN